MSTRCKHCKGPVHEHGIDGWLCLLCGSTEVFVLEEHGYRPCSAPGCEYGWDAARGRACRACGGKGMEVAAP